MEGVSTSVTYLNRTPMYLASMLWCASKNKHQKDVCFQDIGLHAHDEMIVVSSVWVDVTWRKGGVYMTTLISTRISIVVMNEMFILAFKDYEERGYGLDSDLQTISY